MRYFITGATGFIGSRICQQLTAAGHDVVALVRRPANAQALADLGVHLVQGDITDRESMRGPMAGADGVFHIAGWYKYGRRARSGGQRINIDGTRNVLEVMRDLDIPRGVYTSTLGVFFDTKGQTVDETYRPACNYLAEYDRTKWVAHFEVADPMIEAGLPLVIVMPGAVYGPGDTSGVGDMFRSYLRRRLPMIPRGTELCWAHVDDIARGHILAMEKGVAGESYIIGGSAHSIGEVLEMAERITGIAAPALRLGPGVLRVMAAFMGLVEWVAPLPQSYTGEGIRAFAGLTYLGTNAKARRELGYEVRPLEEGLRDTLMQMMDELGVESRHS